MPDFFQRNKVSPLVLTRLGMFLRRLLLRAARQVPIQGVLEHLGSLPLTAQSSLALVRLQRETLLLAITPQGVTLLTKVAAPECRKDEDACDKITRLAETDGSLQRPPVFASGDAVD
jgi:flagellar biogenesis protein FliO